MNCFQNLYLWLSETAHHWSFLHHFRLWIAFKICIFDFQKQLAPCASSPNSCCELLSKFVSLTFRNSFAISTVCVKTVVNCFQNLYLWLSETAKDIAFIKDYTLWIAFKICIFDFQKQQQPHFWNNRYSCELLSKFVSLTFRNS